MSAQTDTLRRKLATVPAAVRAVLTPALHKSAQELVDGIKALVPVEHGELRDSIKLEEKSATRVEVREGDGLVYAKHVEYGTRHAPAHPHFWPAYRLLKKRLQRRTKSAIRASVKEAFRNG